MRKISFLIGLCIIGITKMSNAQQQVSEIEAKNAAINTLRNKTEVLKVSSDDRIKTVNSLSNANGDTIMYEVVFQNGAAVLLSGSKTCLPVLGFYVKDDNNAVFDPNNDNIPCGLKALLKNYADEIEWWFAQDTMKLYHEEKWQELQQPFRGGAPPFVHVDTLLTTKWGQSVSNKGSDCPAYNYYVTQKWYTCGCSSTKRCPVGCTAVAMGQIMKYWNYPVYLPNNSYQYDWCNMPDSLITMSLVCRDTSIYHPPTPRFPNGYWTHHTLCDTLLNFNYEKERHSIARLLKDCAKAVNAVHCAGGCHTSATAIDARRVLVNKFNYSSDAVFRLRSSHPINHNNVWIDYLRTNLNAGRPVLYGSLGLGDAHYWVCDGYGDDGGGNSYEYVYFHMNFGWTGEDDGWYTLNGLSGVGHYNISQEAIFDIYPSTNENYCNYTFSLDDHFASGGTHQNVPQTFMKLESASETSSAAWRTIQSGENAEYVAHQSIIFKPGFSAKAGSHFIARIDTCNGCDDTQRSVLLSNSSQNSMGTTLFYDNEMFNTTLQSEIYPKALKLYPNPNLGTFQLETNFPLSEIANFKITNLLGVTVYEPQNLDSNTIQLPSSSSGLYFVMVILKDGSVFTQKMVVQK
jgi:hypothetical protein